MKLKYAHNCYWLKCSYDERQIAQEAGFKWSKPKKLFFTTDPIRALKFAKYAVDPDTELMLADIQLTIDSSKALFSDYHVDTPPDLSLYPFQRAAVEYAIDNPRVLVADQMRMGKTLEAIGVINQVRPDSVLIICPATVKLNWNRELKKWLTDCNYSIGVAYGNKPFPNTSIVIINYDILTRFEEVKHPWSMLICDECHYLKNPKAQRTKAALNIKADRAIMLTGTPIVNRPKDIWPVLNYLHPKTYPSFFRFAMRYCDAKNGSHGWDFNGASNLEELNDKLRATVMVRRLRRDVIKDFPAKQRTIIEIPVNSKALANELKNLKKIKKEVNKLERLSAIARIRHETALLKAPHVASHIMDMLLLGEKVVCFAWHQDVIQKIVSELEDFNPLVITGQTLPTKRFAIVDEFLNDPNRLFFIGNILAAGIGIKLSVASTIVFAELDWVPGNMSQAEDRCFDLTKKNPIFVQHIVMEKSIDHQIANALIQKQAIIDAALDGKGVIEEDAATDELLDQIFNT